MTRPGCRGQRNRTAAERDGGDGRVTGRECGRGGKEARSMGHTPMPKLMRRAVNQLVSEAVERCQEVLSYAEPDVTRLVC